MSREHGKKHPETLLTKLVTGKVISAEGKPELNGQSVEFSLIQIDWFSKGGVDNCVLVSGLGCLAWIEYSSMELVKGQFENA